MDRRTLRWVVPGAVTVAVAAAIAVPSLAAADRSTADLDDLDAAELLTAMAEADPVPMSGTVVYTARLGLPDVPAEVTGGADPLNLLAGSSTIRVWTDGVDRSRTSLLGATSEYSVVTDGPEAWSYASATDQVRHVTLDAQSQELLAQAQEDREAAAAAGDVPTPQELADQLLERAQEDAEVTMAEPVSVAGRSAYQLVVTPSTTDTLVDRIVVSVDGETFVPLSVEVWSTQNDNAAAVELAYTDVSFTTPSDASLTFSVPSGATVEEKVVDLSEHLAAAETADADAHGTLPEGVTVTGEGFATVVERTDVDIEGLLSGDPAAVADQLDGTPADDAGEELFGEFDRPDGLDAAALYEQLTTPVDGGRVISSALLSVLITDDGRVLVGAVPPETLLEIAGLA
jgi:outer membrane lipoprotein-sorting protein